MDKPQAIVATMTATPVATPQSEESDLLSEEYVDDVEEEDEEERKRNAVVLTGPNGIELTEGMVRDFASFIGSIFNVKLTDEKQNFLRQIMFAEWSHDDQLGALSFGFPVALFQKLGSRWEREQEENEPGNSAIDYWRQVIIYDFEKLTAKAEAANLRPTFTTLQQIRQKLELKTVRRPKDLRMDEYTFECFKNLVIDLANLLYEVELHGGSWIYCKDIINEMPEEIADLLAGTFMQHSFLQFIWPLISEAEKQVIADGQAKDFGYFLKFGRETGFWGSEEEIKKARMDWLDAHIGQGQPEQSLDAQPTGKPNLEYGEGYQAMLETQRKEIAELEERLANEPQNTALNMAKLKLKRKEHEHQLLVLEMQSLSNRLKENSEYISQHIVSDRK